MIAPHRDLKGVILSDIINANATPTLQSKWAKHPISTPSYDEGVTAASY